MHMEKQTHIKTWLKSQDRPASWLGRQLELGATQSADLVAGRAKPSMAQKLAIELLTDGAVRRDQWGHDGKAV